jgi:glycosyltransferase involved in cell wall biosynthesis
VWFVRTLNSEIDIAAGKPVAMPRILAVMGYDSSYGGERANVQVLKLMRERGAQIECVVREERAAEKFVSVLRSENFPLHSTHFGPGLFGLQKNPFRYFKNLYGMFRVSVTTLRVASRFKPTHIYVPNFIQFLYVWPAVCVLRRPVVFRIGDPPETTFLHRLMWSKIIAPRVAAFVTNSEYTRQRLLTSAGCGVNCRVIRNCTTRNGELADGGRKAVGGGRWVEGVPLVVSYLGQIKHSKGVHVAVDVAIGICHNRPDVLFQFIGLQDSISPYAEGLMQKVREAGLESRICFKKYFDDIQPVLSQSALHLCPSLQYESLANVVIEAKQAGVPSVVFPTGGLPEQVRHTVNGFVCRTPDVAGLTEGILFFLYDPKRIGQAGEAARKSVSEYSPAAVGQVWEKLFGETHRERASSPLKG